MNLIYFPFIYFSILFTFLFLKNGKKIDIACFIIAIYGVSAFFSILIDVFHIRSLDTAYYNISFKATLTYCGLISLCTLPFIVFSHLKNKKIQPLPNSNILIFFAWLFFIYFIIYTLLSLSAIIRVLTGDLAELRMAHYNGEDEEFWLSSIPFIIRWPFTLMNMLTGSSWILIFLGFYCVVIQKMKVKYGILFLCASLIGIIRNIVVAGRSDVVYWLIGFGACYIYFKPFFDNSQWKKFKKYLFPPLLLLLYYMYTSTQQRFEDKGTIELGGTESSFISYYGQSFINYCFFFDKYESPIYSLQIIFPFTYQLLGNSMGSIVEIQRFLTINTGYRLGVFYTFIGQITVTTNNKTAIIFCIIFSVISLILLNRLKNIKRGVFAPYCYLLLSSVIYLGLFSHYYGLITKSFSAIAFCFIFHLIFDRWNKQKKK